MANCDLRRPATAPLVFLQVQVDSDPQAGKLEAYRIDRSALHGCKAYFHYFMDNLNKALHDVALHLFDRHGHLKTHLYGTFGPETNEGGLIFIRTLPLEPKYQGGNIASQALQELLSQLNGEDCTEASWNLAGTKHTMGATPHCLTLLLGIAKQFSCARS